MARGGRARRTPFSTYRIRKRPRDDRSGALSISGGDDGIRTHDPHVANVMLSQLSYIPRNRQDSILALGCVVVNGYVARNRKSITPRGCGATVRVDGRTGPPATPRNADMPHRTRLLRSGHVRQVLKTMRARPFPRRHPADTARDPSIGGAESSHEKPTSTLRLPRKVAWSCRTCSIWWF